MDEHRDRTWDQFIDFYETCTRVRGTYLWAAQLTDPETIEAMVQMKQADWDAGGGPPPLFGWNDLIDKLTDLADQMIASRAQSDKVTFMPRPVIPAVKLRKSRHMNVQETAVERARKANLERRRAAGGI